ncbi:MAG: response regulator [Campylobacterota bacterium]|nr:response regulator [Campylobacterota bacterium]
MRAILCVDDEEFVLRALSQDLEKNFSDDYTIELAQSAKDALEILDELEEDSINVVIIISDWLMPGMKGDEFLIEAHKKFPKVIKILLTGQADKDAIQNVKDYTNLKDVIAKPWDSIELIKLIKNELGDNNE